MTEPNNIISIVKNQGSPTQEIIDIKTDGFLLLYIKDDKIKTSGDIELKALAPFFMRLALDKMTKT